MTADQSILAGGALVDDLSTSNLSLNNGPTWTLKPAAGGTVASSVSVLNLNDSTVAFAAPVGDVFQSLTVGSGVPGARGIISILDSLQPEAKFFASVIRRLVGS